MKFLWNFIGGRLMKFCRFSLEDKLKMNFLRISSKGWWMMKFCRFMESYVCNSVVCTCSWISSNISILGLKSGMWLRCFVTKMHIVKFFRRMLQVFLNATFFFNKFNFLNFFYQNYLKILPILNILCRRGPIAWF